MTDAPTLDPDWILEVRQWLQDRGNTHAAAVTAERDAEIAQLRADNTRLQNEVVMPLRERVRVLEDALRCTTCGCTSMRTRHGLMI